MKYLFSLQLFGGGQDADAYDEQDSSPNDGLIDFKVGNKSYSVPKQAFDDVGTGSSGASKMYMASIFAAYALNTHDFIKTKSSVYTKKEYQQHLSKIQEWYKQETGSDLKVPDGYGYEQFVKLVMIDNGYSMPLHLEGLARSDLIKIDGQNYQTWENTQPQFQPGYDKTLGVPVAKTSTGEYVYKNGGGSYVLSSGQALPEGVSLQHTQTNQPIQIGEGGLLYDVTTGEIIKGFGDNTQDARKTAETDYLNSLFSKQEGTLGGDILANSTSLFEKQAANAQLVAETSMQQQALAQAQGIKQVTDSLRNERMSQLRAGMSESQLADRELSMLMSSVDTFNTQAQQSAQDSLTAQLGANTAKEEAYNEYLTHVSQIGQTYAADRASQASSVPEVAARYYYDMQAAGTPKTWDQAYDYASGITMAKVTGGN